MGKPKCSGENHQFIYLQIIYKILSRKKIQGKTVGEWYNQAATNCKKKDKRKKKPWVNSTTKHPRIAIKIEEGKNVGE